MAMASLNPGNQQITRIWVAMLNHSSTMNLREFYDYFYKPIQPAVDLVVIYDNDDSQCGFGFVVNEESKHTGGSFRTVPYWADQLKTGIANFSHTLRNMHCTAQSQTIGLLSGAINYAQLKGPLNPSLLQQGQIANYFKNRRPSCDFLVVPLFPEDRCGFGFVQIPPGGCENSNKTNYLAELRVLVHELMAIVDGGITAICGNFSGQRVIESGFAPIRPFLNPPSGSDSSRIQSAIQQQQLPGWGATGSNSNFGMQHQQPQSLIFYQPTPAVMPYEATNTPSGANMWSGQPASSGRLSVGEQHTNQWSGSRNAAAMQPFCYQPRAAVIPYGATNTPSGAYMWSGQPASSSRLSVGEQNTSQWSGSRNAAAMQPFCYQPRAAVIPYGATNTPSGAYMWSGQLPSSGRLSGGEQNTNQWSGSRNAAAMQQPQPPILSQPRAAVIPYGATNTPSGANMWIGQATSTGRLSGGEQNANQSPGSGNAINLMQQQQQPDSIHSRDTGANRLGQSRNA